MTLDSLPSISEASVKLRSRELTPIELLEYCLERIDQFEDSVHAWVSVDRSGAREAAEKQTSQLAEGIDPGPLAGIPIGIKDIVDVEGWPTRAGSPLREGHVAASDARLVAKLRRAGAIILGKTVTTQFACFDPAETRNPWNLSHTPGGSSSGSAASVALEMCMAAIGTQTGGSIIRPASYCGVAGFKPSFGSVSLDGVVPVSFHLDHAGPIARSSTVVAKVYKVIRERDNSSPITMTRPELHLFQDFFPEHTQAPVKEVFETALASFGDALKDDPLPLPSSFRDLHTHHKRIMAVEAAEVHRGDFQNHPEQYAENIAKLIRLGLGESGTNYASSLSQQRRFRNEIEQVLVGGKIVVLPSTNTVAPSMDSTGDPLFNSPWSYAGNPAATIPIGLSEDGLPCGMQLVGPFGYDSEVLFAAAWCENQISFATQHQPPLTVSH